MKLTPAQSRTLEMLAHHHEAQMIPDRTNTFKWVIAGLPKSRTIESLRAVGLIEFDGRMARLSETGRRIAREWGLLS
jgi:hypothetical protein